LSITFAPPGESTPVVDAIGQRNPGRSQTQALRKERRRTLDEELREASPSYSDEERALVVPQAASSDPGPSYSDEERVINDMQHGTFVGVGTRSKRLGFFAHGGAGGEPVFMGVGNVEGAVAEDPPQTPHKSKAAGRKKKTSSTTSTAKRKKKT